MSRQNLLVDVFYLLPNGTTFTTPDGLGGWWYDSLDEAIDQHGEAPIHRTNQIPF